MQLNPYFIIGLNFLLVSVLVSNAFGATPAAFPVDEGKSVLKSVRNSPAAVQPEQQVSVLADSMPAYTGVIYYKGEVLDEIRWVDHAGVKSKGIFSFPINKSKNYELYTPWKEGYSFYPEVVKFDENNTHQVFTAIRLSLHDELIYQFDFEKGVQNEVDKVLNEHELFSVHFRKEKGRGKVLSFNKPGAAVQFKRSPEFDTSKPFTISVWVNPDSVSGIHTLVSKGLVFSFKIRHGGVSFAGTGFNSVISDSLLVLKNEWQHLSCVCVPGYHVQFFRNGQLVHDEAFDSLRVNEQALTIGNNYSNEAFSGKIDKLMLWNRALSNEEIAMVYNERSRLNSLRRNFGWFLVLILPGLVVAYRLIQRKRKIRKTTFPEIQSVQQSAKKDTYQSTVCLFGDLHIPGPAGENLARQLSPRLKQLFVLLAIHPKGLSISRINSDLWPGIDEEKAKQSRNYAIQQLKKVLSANPALRLEYLSKNWILQFDENVKVDVLVLGEIEELLKHQTSHSLIDTYLTIVERGKFLPGIDNECFDAIKARISESISNHFSRWNVNASPKTALRLGSCLLLQDSLSEDGLGISVRALTALGRNGEALEMYQVFAKRYKNTYNEEFSAPLQSFL
jgi:two-component SAPR family response regulator